MIRTMFAVGCLAAALSISTGCSAVPARSGDARLPIVLDEFLLLESSLDEGSKLDIDQTTPGVVAYSGGSLPESRSPKPVMYTFKTDFSVSEADIASGLSLYLGLSEFPYRVYLNGEELCSRGRYRDGEYTSSLRLAEGVNLPPSMLRVGAFNTLVVEAYPKYETWALDAIYVDSSDEITFAVFLRTFVGVNIVQAICVLSLLLGVYFLLIWFLERRKNPRYLYFTLLCASFCLSYLDVLVYNDVVNELPVEVLSKAGLMLISTFMLMFCCEFAGLFENASKTRKRLLHGTIGLVGLASAIAMAIQPGKRELMTVFGWATNCVISPELAIDVVLILYALVRRRDRHAIPILVAFVALVATAGHDIVYLAANALPYAWLAPYGYLAFIVAIFSILAVEQTQLYRKSVQQMVDIVVGQGRIENLNVQLTKERDSFRRFVPTEFLELLGHKSATEIRLGDSSLRRLSVMFSDIRGYSGISEGMTPDRNLRYLNDYLNGMEKAIRGNRGFVDKYIGDAILALFPFEDKAPEGRTLNADAAISAAMDMKRALADFNAFARGSELPGIDIGVGINTGEAILGTVGSEARLDTTVIGDAVNVASRLEGLTKFYQARFIVSEETVNALVDPGRHRFRMIDHVCVVGRRKGIRIYELLDEADEGDRRKLDAAAEYGEALDLYRARDFEGARQAFEHLAVGNPDDRAPIVLENRCATMIATPPSSNWDGTYRFYEK